MEITIPENPEKGNGKKFFVPALIVLVGVGGFGLGRLSKIDEMRPPVTVASLAEDGETRRETLGSTEAAQTPASASGTPSSAATTTSKTQSGNYVAARGGTAYYLPWCAAAQRIADKNKIWFETKEEAERMGYKPAQNCKGM